MSMVRVILAVCAAALIAAPAAAFDPKVMDSVVRLKPDWSMAKRSRDAQGAPRDPEGTGVAVLPGGYIATNVHVIGDATEVQAMLSDGRVMQAGIVGRHGPTDIALLRIDVDLPVPEMAAPPALGAPVCAVGNQFGLGLSVTCGVTSAVGRSGTGFNPIEDFIQTDATVNPGGSGGALVNGDTELVGLVSAIFTKQSDADIGVNFAASTRLLMRVVRDLRDYGKVIAAEPGFEAQPLPPPLASEFAGAIVSKVDENGAALAAGLEAGDVITHVDGRAVRSFAELRAVMFMARPGDEVVLTTRRGPTERAIRLRLPGN